MFSSSTSPQSFIKIQFVVSERLSFFLSLDIISYMSSISTLHMNDFMDSRSGLEVRLIIVFSRSKLLGLALVES